MPKKIKLSETELGQEWIRVEARRLGLGPRHFDALGAQLDDIDLKDSGILERYLFQQLSLVASALPKPVAIYLENDFGSADFFQHTRVRTSKGKTPLRATSLAHDYRPDVRQSPVTEVFIRVLMKLHRTRRSWPFRPTPNELRLSKCRSILLVGSELFEPNYDQQLLPSANLRVSRLFESLLKSPSVKSWRSYGLLRSVVPFCPLGYGMTWGWRHRLEEFKYSTGLSADSLEYANAIVVLGKHNRENLSFLDGLRKEIAKSKRIDGRFGKLPEDTGAQTVVDLNFLLGSLEAGVSTGKPRPSISASSAKLASPCRVVASSTPSAAAYELHAQLTSLQSYIADMLVVLPDATRSRVQSVITRFLFESSVDQVQKNVTEGKPKLAEQMHESSIGEDIREIWGTFARLDQNEKIEAQSRFKEPSSQVVPTRGALGEFAP